MPAGEERAAALGDVAWNRYPDRTATGLRAALGGFLGQDPDRITCGNGSNEVLLNLFLAYGGAGRKALLFEPTYALHAQIARITGTGVIAEPRGADFSVDPDRAAEVIAREREDWTMRAADAHSRVTDLAARPLLAQVDPALAALGQPLSGQIAARFGDLIAALRRA